MSLPAEERDSVVVPFRRAPAPAIPDTPAPARPARVLQAVRVRGGQLVVKAVPKHPVRMAKHGAGLGAQGVVRATGRWWRWVTVAEYDGRKDAPPALVEQVRKERRKKSLWGTGTVIVTGVASWLYWWPLPVLEAGVFLTVAGTVELFVQRSIARAEGRVALGSNPGSKAVRRAVAHAKLGRFDDIKVIAPGVVRDSSSWSALVELPPGGVAVQAAKKRLQLASAIGVDVAQVVVDPVRGHAGRFELWVADSDPLAGETISSPLVARIDPFDVWREKVMVGVGVRGRPLGFRLPERSILTGGEPGAGKSVACNNVLCSVALDPRSPLWLIDGKGGSDLLDYEPLAQRFIGEADPEAVYDMLGDLQDEMSDRYRRLKAIGARKVTAELADELNMHLLLLHIDELQAFTTHEELGKKITTRIWDLVSRGRASLVVVSGATQRPVPEVVASRLRDILSIRWALRCTNAKSSDSILGDDWAAQGYNAGMLDPIQRGAGYLLAETPIPQSMRTYFLTDREVEVLAKRAYKFREQAGTLPMSDARPGVRLLKDVLRAMGDVEKIATERLLADLTTHTGYAGWDATRLADELRPFEVRPADRWIDGRNQRGYLRTDVIRALDRA